MKKTEWRIGWKKIMNGNKLTKKEKTVSFSIKGNYNFEILSFLNVLTSDEYYVRLNKKAYEIFFPIISNQSRENIFAMLPLRIRLFVISANHRSTKLNHDEWVRIKCSTDLSGRVSR